MTLHIIPCSTAKACAYIEQFHRHHGVPSKASFSVAVLDDAGQVHGVAVVGTPVARLLDDGLTAEVSRCCTDGFPNACSALYGACRRTAKQLGYRRLFTYTREDENGASLRASGWTCDGPRQKTSWMRPNQPNRVKTDKTEVVGRQRWSIILNPMPLSAVWPTVDDNQLQFFEVVA